jgi:hypothetical protein
MPKVELRFPMPKIQPPQFPPPQQWQPQQWQPPIPPGQNNQAFGVYAPAIENLNAAKQTFDEMTLLWMVFIAVAGGIALIWVGAQLYVRWSTPTDPAKLAMSDPWVRQQLAQEEAHIPPPPAINITQPPVRPNGIRLS